MTDLQQHLRDLEDDLSRKSLALSLDQRCFDERNKLKSHDLALRSQTDKNLKLTGSLRKTERFLENSTVTK